VSPHNRLSECIATIGGTFDTLHAGHKEYVRLAFSFSEHVRIYVTADEFARRYKKYPVRPYEARVEKLLEYLQQNFEARRYQIRRLRSLENLREDFLETPGLRECLHLAIVTPEYYDFFQELNRRREARGIKSFLTLVKQRTLTRDRRELSSFEVRKRLPANGKHAPFHGQLAMSFA
jgi:cytidyltransferase-like protein